jgi:hypothetical protein
MFREDFFAARVDAAHSSADLAVLIRADVFLEKIDQASFPLQGRK